MDDIIAKNVAANNPVISGEESFELSDTYGFPIDLTQLIAQENNCSVDLAAFEAALQLQKDRSRKDAKVDSEDWISVNDISTTSFVGYDQTTVNTKICKYRKVSAKGKTQYQLVLEQTPFYAESGGQVGDTGILTIGHQQCNVTDTKKENDLIIHFCLLYTSILSMVPSYTIILDNFVSINNCFTVSIEVSLVTASISLRGTKHSLILTCER